jgi:hypothetical protein
LDAVWLFRVTLRLRNFADHARMHGGHLLGRLVGFSKNKDTFRCPLASVDGSRGFAARISSMRAVRSRLTPFPSGFPILPQRTLKRAS